MFNDTKVDQMKGPYGCGINLAIELLKRFDKERYTMIYLNKQEKKLKENN